MISRDRIYYSLSVDWRCKNLIIAIVLELFQADRLFVTHKKLDINNIPLDLEHTRTKLVQFCDTCAREFQGFKKKFLKSF